MFLQDSEVTREWHGADGSTSHSQLVSRKLSHRQQQRFFFYLEILTVTAECLVLISCRNRFEREFKIKQKYIQGLMVD